MINNAVIMGRLTAGPELKHTPQGIAVTRFTAAVDRAYQKNKEERKADFIDVVCWRGTAEFVTRYFRKGSMIAVTGSIQTGSYEKDGIRRRTFEIAAEKVSFCGGKKAETQQGTPIENMDDFEEIPDDSDLPF